MTGAAAPDDPAAYARQLKAEVEAEAEQLRRRHPGVVRREREIERAWARLAPVRGMGDEGEDLLVRVERFAHADVDAPFGAKPGIRQVKQAVRKLVYWYLRYLADQINVWNSAAVRWMRRTDRRLRSLEAAAQPWSDESALRHDSAVGVSSAGEASAAGGVSGAGEPSGLRGVFAIGDVNAGTAASIAGEMAKAEGLVAVMGCGEGAVLEALATREVPAYGVDPSPERITGGADRGLDLRPGQVIDHLSAVEDGSLGGVVLTGAAAGLPVASTVAVAAQAVRVVASGGVIVVAAADTVVLSRPERDLRAGRGVAPETWAYLLERAGCRVARRGLDSHGPVTELVAARLR